MTTCFAHFVRGAWGDSARANPAGLMLAIVCVVLIPWCWASAALGRSWLVPQPGRAFLGIVSTLFAAALLQWAMKVLV